MIRSDRHDVWVFRCQGNAALGFQPAGLDLGHGFALVAFDHDDIAGGEAGENVFTIKSFNLYGMNSDQLPIWNSFLEGKMTVAEITSRYQASEALVPFAVLGTDTASGAGRRMSP